MVTAQSSPHSSSRSCTLGNVKAEMVPDDPFPAGLRVMVVDDDPICLLILDRMLKRCSYQVTTCGRAADALEMLRENKDNFDLVISDVYMPDMDGFKLLELVGLEMELPVIMMSANGETSAVMKGIKHGACDYLLKPVRIEELKNIWQHVVRKKWRASQQAASFRDNKVKQGADDSDLVSSANEGLDGVLKHSRKRKDIKEEDEDADQENDDPLGTKKPRVVWSVDLHQQFVAAVNQLGIDKAVPKRILELMNVQGLTRENVASHLQKYRLYLKRISGAVHQPGGLHPPFAGSPDSSFGAVSAGGFGGMGDLRTLAATGQLSPQALMSTLQAGLLGRLGLPNNLGIGGVDPSVLLQVAALQSANTSATSRPSYGPPLIDNQENLQARPSDVKQLVQISQPPTVPLGLVAGALDKGPTGMLALEQKQQLALSCGFECMGQLAGLNCDLQVDPHNNSLMLQALQQQIDGRLAEGLISPTGGVQGQYGVLADMEPWVSSNMNSASAAIGTGVDVQSSSSFRAGPVSLLGVASYPTSIVVGSQDNKGPHLTVPNSLVDVSSPLASTGLDSDLGPSRIKNIVGTASMGSPQTLSSFSSNFISLSGVKHRPGPMISQRNQGGWQGFSSSQEFGQANSPVPSPPRHGQASSSNRGLALRSSQEQGQLCSPSFTRLFPGNLGVEGGLVMPSVGNTPSRSEQSTADSVLKVKEENVGIWTGSKTEQGLHPSDDLFNILLKQHQEKMGLMEGHLAAGDSYALNNMYVK